MENIYLHAINPEEGFWDTSKTLKITEQILKDDKILTRRELEKNGNYPNSPNTPLGFAGLDYISLVDYSKKNARANNPLFKNYTAFLNYASHSLAFGFSSDLEVITPEILEPRFFNTRLLNNKLLHLYLEEMRQCGLSKDTRYSDFPDEVQYFGPLPLDKFIGLTLHIKTISLNSNNPKNTLKKLKELIKELQDLLIYYQKNPTIFDLDSLMEIKNEEDAYEAMHKYTLF